MWTLPNILTVMRLGLLPPLIFFLYLQNEFGAWAALILYAFAAVTDFFDGMAARRLNQVSRFGQFLDPIADKIFVACILILLVGFGQLGGLWMMAALVIMIREFLIAGLREFLGPSNVQIHVTSLAKWKTTVQMVALGLLIIGPYIPYGLIAGQILIAVAAILTAITGWDYLKQAFPHLR